MYLIKGKNMKKIISILVIVLLLSWNVFATGTVLSLDAQIKQDITEKVDLGVPTIKRFLSERGECKNIFTSATITNWSNEIVAYFSYPIEIRTANFNTQKAPLDEEIAKIQADVDNISAQVEAKKNEFFNWLWLTNDTQALIDELKSLQNQLLKRKGDFNVKNQELKNITSVYQSFPYISKEDIKKLVSDIVMKHCGEWVGKVELTDKKVLDLKSYSVSLQNASEIWEKPSKYKKLLDKIDLMYIKNPETLKKLLKRIQKVIPKISKSNENYQLLVDVKHHLEKLFEEPLLKITP